MDNNLFVLYSTFTIRAWLGGKRARAVHPVQRHWWQWLDGLGGGQGMDGILTQMELDNEKNSVAARSFTKFPSQAWIIPPDFDHSEAEAKVIFIINHHILLLSWCTHSIKSLSTWCLSLMWTVMDTWPKRRSWRSMICLLALRSVLLNDELNCHLNFTFQATDFGEALSRHDEF